MLIINLIEMYTNLMLQVYGIFLTNEKILVLDVVVFSAIKKTTLAAFLHKQPCRASNQFVYYLQMISRLCTRMVEGGAALPPAAAAAPPRGHAQEHQHRVRAQVRR